MSQKQKPTSLSKQLFAAWRDLPHSSPQRWFTVVALMFGGIFACTSPAYTIPDELAHTAHAWHIAKGEAIAMHFGNTSGTDLPTSFRELGKTMSNPSISVTNMMRLPLNSAQTAPEGFPNLAPYSPLVYVPQAIGLQIGETFNMSVYFTFTLGRLMNLVAYVALFYWAIRLLPFGKWVAAVIGLLPMHLLLAGSMSADPVSIGMAALAVGVVLYVRDRATRINRYEYIALLGFIGALSLTKLPFPLLITLFLLLPVSVLGGTVKQRWKLLGGMAAVGLVIGAGWLLAAKSGMAPYGPVDAIVDPAAQVAHVIHHPLGFLKAAFITLVSPVSDFFMRNYVISAGPVIAWLPMWATYVYTVFLALSIVGIRTSSKAVLSRAQKQLVVALVVCIIIAILLLLYISWTPVGARTVDGMQSRYFTPFLILLIPLAAGLATKLTTSSRLLSEAWLRYLPVAFLVASVIAEFYYFYHVRIQVPF
ncbi:MAG TPA: DUF2142 domain-containing protein [Magnetospirillaceae bacterium]|nr:DUF2142 domain-containing protein [Magnetospirillaceae bacterium]